MEDGKEHLKFSVQGSVQKSEKPAILDVNVRF